METFKELNENSILNLTDSEKKLLVVSLQKWYTVATEKFHNKNVEYLKDTILFLKGYKISNRRKNIFNGNEICKMIDSLYEYNLELYYEEERSITHEEISNSERKNQIKELARKLIDIVDTKYAEPNYATHVVNWL